MDDVQTQANWSKGTRYEPEGHGFGSRRGHWPKASIRFMAPGLVQLPAGMSSGKLLRFKGRSARKADSLTAICEPIV
jgi:hypothetical protein